MSGMPLRQSFNKREGKDSSDAPSVASLAPYKMTI